ncbi:MAG: tetratricopeptide repeat protein [Candidatus Korobacteraceae bacterium]
MKPRPSAHSLSLRLLADSPAHFALLNMLLVVAIVGIYWPVHTHGYMQTDDYFYVVDNVHIHHGLDWPTVKWAFTATDMVNWIPVTWLSHAVDYRLFGADPTGHHLMNVVFHALAAVLLFWTLKHATGYLGRSFMVAALFALHPINVEAVAWVAERKTMLSTIFLVLALSAYRWYALQPSTQRYSLVTLLYVLGLMAKSQIIMLPFLLLLWDYWPLQRMFPATSGTVEGTNSFAPLQARSFAALVNEKLPLFLLGLTDAIVTLHVQGAAQPEYWPYTLSTRMSNAVVAYARYIGKALWPQWLAVFYPHPGTSLMAWQVTGALAVLSGITVLVLCARRHRYLRVGWLWFLISLVPMSGIVHFGTQAMADRYAYLPLCGIFIMICWGVAEWSRQRHLPAALLAGGSMVLLASLAALTYRQVNFWSDDLTLWSHSLEVATDNTAAEVRVGGDLLQRGRDAEALQHFTRGLSLDPADPLGNLGLAFYEQKHSDLRSALEHYQRVLQAPEVKQDAKRLALINMGRIYDKFGDSERARQCFEAAARIHVPQV